ncbi:PREDICTED: protein spartin isoform X1 [Rhagoletis zephyria]|uniref:protein spartin isoform X1 n=1 Tax=Rhagoletis zephyria TaxID=28612 RepID=UPI000811A161|nr:PREDICTED: protein spartin isoform X1 [Rhagoletis zephyria]
MSIRIHIAVKNKTSSKENCRKYSKLVIMSTEAEFLGAYERMKSSNKRILACIDEAIGHEEHDRLAEAIDGYEHCLQQIDETFAISVGLPDNIDAVAAEWKDACAIVQKLKSAKVEVRYRLKVLRAQNAPVDSAAIEAKEEDGAAGGGAAREDDADAGPSPKKKSLLLENPVTHEGTSATNGTTISATAHFRKILSDLRHVIADTTGVGILFDTLFQSQAKLYKIQPDGVVVTMGETSMSLVMCTTPSDEQWKHLNGISFVQCTIPTGPSAHNNTEQIQVPSKESPQMIWLYALLPAITICYRTSYGAFILPDLEIDEAGHAFGLMLIERDSAVDGAEQAAAQPEEPEELSDLQQFFLDLLEAVLSGRVELLQQPIVVPRPPRDASEQVSRHIVTAADFIARNLVRGAEKTGELMVKTTPYIISKMKPAPPDARPVSSTVQTSVTVARDVTHAAVGVTGWIAGKVGSASMAIGRYLAPHVQSAGSTLLQKGFGYDPNEAHSKMEGAMTIAAGAVEGFSTVYDGLETSAKILGTNLSENSVKIIEHKYGSSAGGVAAGTFDTLGNAFNVSQNVNYITPKGLAKKMAKNTGKAVIDDYKTKIRHAETNFVPAGALYPDLRTLKEK